MQDEVNEKVVSLAIKTSKLTAEVLQKAMKALSDSTETDTEHLYWCELVCGRRYTRLF